MRTEQKQSQPVREGRGGGGAGRLREFELAAQVTFARPPGGPGSEKRGSALDQTYVAGSRTLGRLFGRELYTLAFAEQLENRTADGAAVEEVFDTTFISDEPEPLVDEEASDRAVGHSRIPPMRAKPETISGAHGPLTSGI